jgi:glycosyltransferase 2 family protein
LNKYLLNFLKFTLFLGVGLSILYFVYSKYNVSWEAQCVLDGKTAEECGTLAQKIWSDFLNVNFFWIFIVLVAFTISNLSRALRWNMMIRPLGYVPRLANSFFCIIIGYFANLFLPRVGEVIRAATMSKYEKIPVEKLVGTIVVGRTMDVICLASAIGLTILLEFNTVTEYLANNRATDTTGGNSIFESPVFLMLVGLGIVVGILLFVFRAKVSKSKIYIKIIGFLKGLWEGIMTVRKMESPWVFVFHSLNIWFMYYLMAYLCFFAFAPTSDLSPLAGLVTFVFGAFGIVIPSPGGMGTYHYFTSEALMIYGVSAVDAFSFANILFFSIQIGCNMIIGVLSLILLPIINRNYEPKPKLIV